MIKIEHVVGPSSGQIEFVIEGMRNPMNSWSKSDSQYWYFDERDTDIGENDLALMSQLSKAGPTHRKYLRMLPVYLRVTAPLYWWKEFDTYKVGTVSNSCSTMHKIQSKEFNLDDFSHEHLDISALELLKSTTTQLNIYRNMYNNYDPSEYEIFGCPSKKDIWWQMIQLLPSSYNQTRNVMLNYEVLVNIYSTRKYHKLDEWQEFCMWIETIPYFDDIIKPAVGTE